MVTVRLYVVVKFGVKLSSSITLEAKTRDVEQELQYEINNYLCYLYNQVCHILRSFSKKILQDKKE